MPSQSPDCFSAADRTPTGQGLAISVLGSKQQEELRFAPDIGGGALLKLRLEGGGVVSAGAAPVETEAEKSTSLTPQKVTRKLSLPLKVPTPLEPLFASPPV